MQERPAHVSCLVLAFVVLLMLYWLVVIAPKVIELL